MSDHGTPVPDLRNVKNTTQHYESDGWDIHTVTVLLYDGAWLLILAMTDDDMEEREVIHYMDNYGMVGTMPISREVLHL